MGFGEIDLQLAQIWAFPARRVRAGASTSRRVEPLPAVKQQVGDPLQAHGDLDALFQQAIIAWLQRAQAE